ncbi:MAG: Gfo/Idh/MocA family oxidoreductase [Candidatus Solibacter usitatus]|nr:Gfo/Idh/MocA family oxidoreductase [Candidatus Solibacter usitatus]
MLNWVVVGIGDIATRRVLPAIDLESRGRLYGVVTRDPEKGRRYSENVWTSLDPALADPQVDVIYLATPVALHAPQTIAALEAGKHVLCEKPVAMHYQEAKSMEEAAARSGRVFGVPYYRRCYPKVQRAKQMIADGVIGRPVFAEASNHGWFDAADGFRGWLVDPALSGGGPLYDIGSHRIDLFNYLFGTPVRVTGQISRVVHARPVEDSATVLIEYENGVRGVVDVRWHCRSERDELRITGTDGVLDLSPLNSPELRYPGGVEHLPIHANIHYPYIENYVSALVDGTPLISSGRTAMVTDWVTEQVMRAASATTDSAT